MKLNNNINFGAKLITPADKFTLPSDSEEVKTNAKKFVKLFKIIVENPNFDKFTSNDTIELKRLKRKNGYAYQIQYKSPDIKDTDVFEHIHMDVLDNKKNFLSISEIIGAFKQISYAQMYKTGLFSKERNLPLFATYEDCFKETFEKSFNEFLINCFSKK